MAYWSPIPACSCSLPSWAGDVQTLWFQSSEAAVTQLQFLICILRSFVGERDGKKKCFFVWEQPEDSQASAVILMYCEKEGVKGLTAAPFHFCEVTQSTDLTLCCQNQREEQSALCCSQACSQCGLGSAPALHTAVQNYAARLLMHPYLNVVGEVSTACVLCVFGHQAEGIAANRDINTIFRSLGLWKCIEIISGRASEVFLSLPICFLRRVVLKKEAVHCFSTVLVCDIYRKWRHVKTKGYVFLYLPTMSHNICSIVCAKPLVFRSHNFL